MASKTHELVEVREQIEEIKEELSQGGGEDSNPEKARELLRIEAIFNNLRGYIERGEKEIEDLSEEKLEAINRVHRIEADIASNIQQTKSLNKELSDARKKPNPNKIGEIEKEIANKNRHLDMLMRYHEEAKKPLEGSTLIERRLVEIGDLLMNKVVEIDELKEDLVREQH